MEDISQYCREQTLEALPISLPLWRVIIFSNLCDNPLGSSAILFRYHRCLTDEISLMRIMLTELQNNPELVDTDILIRSSQSSSESIDGVEETLRTETVNDTPLILVSTEQEIAMNPSVFSQKPHRHCGLQTSRMASYWNLVCTKKDSISPLRSKRVIDTPKERWVEYKVMDVEITDLSHLSHYDLTINDAILGSLYNSLHSYFAPRFQQANTKKLHSMLWVNRRGNDFIYTPVNEGEKLNLNNHDNTAVILELPLSRDSAWDSMMFVHHQMWLKSNCEETTVVQKWLRFWGWLPRSFGDHFFASFMRRGSCSITMIPGPKEPIKFTGNPITSIVNLTSPIGNEEIHISVICYVNKIAVSITADDSICTQEDLAQILSLCNDNLQEIRKHIASWDL